MPIDPQIPSLVSQKLKEIEPHLYAKWDRRRQRFNIWHKQTGRRPYIVMSVSNPDGSYRPIDERTYSQLRHNLWFSKRIRQNMWKLIQDDMEAEARQIRADEDFFIQMGKDIAPLLRNLQRSTGYSAYSKPVPVARGIGDGIKGNPGKTVIRTAV